MRNDLAAVERYADAVSQVLRVAVTPVLCFPDHTIPPEARSIGAVQVRSLAGLVELIVAGGVTRLDDVDSIARLARTLRTPTPKAPSTGRGSETRTQRGSGSAHGGDMAEPSKRRGLVRSIVVTFCGLLLLAGIAGVVIYAVRQTNKALQEFIPTTTTPEPPPLDGPEIAEPTPEVSLAFSCVDKGEGWQVAVGWPILVDQDVVPVAYEIVYLAPVATGEPELWLDRHDPPELMTGLAPGTTVAVAAQGILEDGTRLAPTPVSHTGPNLSC